MGKLEHSRLLGGLTAEEFLTQYWQKKPLLVRGALADFKDLLTPDQLAGLAMEPDCKARLVFEKGPKPWKVLHGPFDEKTLTKLPKTHWSLLVSRVNEYLDSAAELVEQFNFIPHWRIDDLMVSFAPVHGSVGPHVDSYDVFLIQGLGRRNWKIELDGDLTMIDGIDLKVLSSFNATDTWVLEPGDMLYLPPGVAHHGVALEDCLTYSVGFRAPSNLALFSDLFNTPQEWFDPSLTHQGQDERLYEDPELKPTLAPALVSSEVVTKFTNLLTAQLQNSEFASRFVLRHLTKCQDTPLFPRKPSDASKAAFTTKLQQSTVIRTHRYPLAYGRRNCGILDVAVGGQLFELNSDLEPMLEHLTKQLTVSGSALDKLISKNQKTLKKTVVGKKTAKPTNPGDRPCGHEFLHSLYRAGMIDLKKTPQKTRATRSVAK